MAAIQTELKKFFLNVNAEKNRAKNTEQKQDSVENNEESWEPHRRYKRHRKKEATIQRRAKLTKDCVDKQRQNKKTPPKSNLGGTRAITQAEMNKLDAFHRNQLRKVLNYITH
ncbi:hypothetical protein PoB_006023800 [Plakobranchus ocellatus]|uniref:Active regulator of SIRT1 n=1 Tax=Plakobranchus ocellatus TaxID=259542 RepID=A0AAV4CPC0_9GAST|nr:hypothetical protein PoB_006023800 [Plakobranchus ocellatus]